MQVITRNSRCKCLMMLTFYFSILPYPNLAYSRYFHSIIKLNAIINIPNTIPITTAWLYPYRWARGNSSSTEMYTMIPATNAIKAARSPSDRYGSKIKKPKTAPIGSATPDKNEYTKAFFLSPVA